MYSVKDIAIKKAKDKEFINKVFKDLVKDIDILDKSVNGTAIFMAGSPGAGKTEAAESLIQIYKKENIMILDPDKFREFFDGYDGSNSDEFQQASTLLFQKVFDRLMKDFNLGIRRNFIVDTTFAYSNARLNVDRCIRKNITVLIFFIDQDPKIAWQFVQERYKKQGRMVPLSAFEKSSHNSIKNIIEAKKEFDKQVTISVLEKNKDNVISGEPIDDASVGYLEKIAKRLYNTDIELR